MHAVSPPILQESGVHVGASPRQPRRERSASPAPPLGPPSADPHHANPGRSRKAHDAPSLPGRVGQLAARGTQGRLRIVRYQPVLHPIATARHVQSGSPPPPLPPEISCPGLAATSGMAPPVRLNFELRTLQPSGPRSLEQAQPSLVASRHTLRGSAARQGERANPLPQV